MERVEREVHVGGVENYITATDNYHIIQHITPHEITRHHMTSHDIT